MPELSLNQSLNLLRNPAPLIAFDLDSDRLAIPAQAQWLWPEPAEPKISWDSAPEWRVTPFQRAPARDQFAVGRGLGIRADMSTGHRSRRRRARALALRPAHRVFSAGLAARTTPARWIWRPVDSRPLCPASNLQVSSFRVSSAPISNLPVAILQLPILPVPFSPIQQALDRRKVSVGARVSTLPGLLDPGMTLPKMTLIKVMLKTIRTPDSTLVELVWHRFRPWRNASPS